VKGQDRRLCDEEGEEQKTCEEGKERENRDKSNIFSLLRITEYSERITSKGIE